MKFIFTRFALPGLLCLTMFGNMNAQASLSPVTQILLSKQKTLLKSRSLLQKQDTEYMSVFVKVKDPSAFSLIDAQGGVVQTIAGNICTALIPVDQIIALSENPDIISINAAVEVEKTLDVARAASNNTLVNQGQAPLSSPYTGEGVVVGIVDEGIDFTHPTFYSGTSLDNYRIKYAWVQSKSGGTPPLNYNYGTEYDTQANILAVGTDNAGEDHGSHTSGIAAGSGYTTNYKGIAPGSDLYVVGTNMSNTGIIDGVEYIISRAKAQVPPKPCVINLSIGSQVGPHDGTSDFDQMLAEKVGPGVIVVGAAGNSGSSPIHIRTNGTDIVSTVAVPSAYTSTYFISDIWGNPNQNYNVQVSVYSSSGTLIGQTDWVSVNSLTSAIDEQITSPNTTYLVQFGGTLDPDNNKYNMTLFVQGSPFVESESVVISVNPLNNNFVDMWATSATYTNSLSGVSGLVSGDTNYTVGEIGGVAQDIITVGAYITKNEWTDLSNNSWSYGAGYTLNNIAPFSSVGPTADGRIKPDITAPGCGVVSSVNHFNTLYNANYQYTIAENTVNSTTYYWGMMQGTSMATPVVTGSLALWLELNPDLTPAAVKNIFASTAKQNTISRASYPNNTWGVGILDSYAGIVNVLNTVDVPLNNADKAMLVYPNPVMDNCNIQVSGNNKILQVQLSDISGRRVFQKQFSGNNNNESFSLALLPRGIYVMNIMTQLGVKSEKVVLK